MNMPELSSCKMIQQVLPQFRRQKIELTPGHMYTHPLGLVVSP